MAGLLLGRNNTGRAGVLLSVAVTAFCGGVGFHPDSFESTQTESRLSRRLSDLP